MPFFQRKESQAGFLDILSAITLAILLVGVATTSYLAHQSQEIRKMAMEIEDGGGGGGEEAPSDGGEGREDNHLSFSDILSPDELREQETERQIQAKDQAAQEAQAKQEKERDRRTEDYGLRHPRSPDEWQYTEDELREQETERQIQAKDQAAQEAQARAEEEWRRQLVEKDKELRNDPELIWARNNPAVPEVNFELPVVSGVSPTLEISNPIGANPIRASIPFGGNTVQYGLVDAIYGRYPSTMDISLNQSLPDSIRIGTELGRIITEGTLGTLTRLTMDSINSGIEMQRSRPVYMIAKDEGRYTIISGREVYNVSQGKYVIITEDNVYDATTGEKLGRRDDFPNDVILTQDTVGVLNTPLLPAQHVRVTPETFSSDFWRTLSDKVNSISRSDLSGITSLVYNEIKYYPDYADIYAMNINDSNIIDRVQTEIAYREPFFFRNLENVVEKDRSVCFEKAVALHMVLADLGIPSQIEYVQLGSGLLEAVGNHAVVSIVSPDGEKIILDPTNNVVRRIDDYIKLFERFNDRVIFSGRRESIMTPLKDFRR